MCGRYALTTPPSVLAALYRVQMIPKYGPRYNIAPTQVAPVVVQHADGSRQVINMRWGLIPSWAKDSGIGSRMINARSETAAEKPAFRQAFRSRRCVVPITGFYEWRKIGAKKQPYYITRADGEPVSLAGLWESWVDRQAGEEVMSFTILTTDANDMLRPLHDRMPVVMEPEEHDRWLDPKRHETGALRELLKPAADGVLRMHPVSPRVNKPANDDPAVIEPVQLVSEEPNQGESGLFG